MTIRNALDARTHAYRPDLADTRLKGFVEADRFVDGVYRRVQTPTAALRRIPRHDAPIDSEALQGELVRVFEETAEGWSWGQLETDAYVGFFPSETLGPVGPEPTHRVTALRTFVYPGADLKLPPVAALSLQAQLVLTGGKETRGTLYRFLANGAGAVVACHVEPIAAPRETDFVAVAERFLNIPYLWGGRSSLGIDCSGLVQISLAATGRAAPRDTDQQQAALGFPLEGGLDADLRRGDLVFWRGHVGILSDPNTLLHASGFHMAVVREPFAAALQRIEAAGSLPTAVRRLN